MSRHIVFDISGHGFGHAAMSLPVVEALDASSPALRLTIRSGLPEPWLRERCSAAFDYEVCPDFGMAMTDSLRVRPDESLAHYRSLHARWGEVVSEAAEELRSLEPDLVVSNISYLSLAAAHAIGVQAIAYSSLNWADVFAAYCGGLPGADAVIETMAGEYAKAAVFIQPQPSMPMPSIANGYPVPPVARLGCDKSDRIRRQLGLSRDTRLLVVSLGGIPTPISFDAWPRFKGWRVIAGSDGPTMHPDVSSWSDLGLRFIDVLASADALLIKPGYGLITEAVCNAKPFLYVPRDEWPETAAELAWASDRCRAAPIPEEAMREGKIQEPLDRILAAPSPGPPPRPSGAEAVAQLIFERLWPARVPFS